MTTSGSARITTPSDTEILITREFDAPRRLVYRAWTTPELVRRWWPGHQGTMQSVEMDVRVGGRWRYVMALREGGEVAFHGVYREIVPNERIVNTEVFEETPGWDDDESAPVNTATFRETGGRTTLDLLIECHTKELRDAILGSGMEVGVQEQFDLLEKLARDLEPAT